MNYAPWADLRDSFRKNSGKPTVAFARIEGWMKKLHAVIGPHPPLRFPNVWDKNHLEIDPIRFDAIIHAVIRLDPVSVHVPRIIFIGYRSFRR